MDIWHLADFGAVCHVTSRGGNVSAGSTRVVCPRNSSGLANRKQFVLKENAADIAGSLENSSVDPCVVVVGPEFHDLSRLEFSPQFPDRSILQVTDHEVKISRILIGCAFRSARRDLRKQLA